MKPLFLAAITMFLAACGPQQPTAPAGTASPPTSSAPDTSWWAGLGLPEPDTLVIPNEEAGDGRVSVLTVGTFHGDEVDDDAAKRRWTGLFQTLKGGFYLKKTSILQKHVYDPIVDEDETQTGTGWEIGTPGHDSCLLLFSEIKTLAEGPLDTVQGVRPQFIYPGQHWAFQMGGRDYQLVAEGAMKTIDNEEKVVVNYRLWLETSENGVLKRQLLVARPSFDDAMIELLWVGDMDRDARPDFVFNLSDHYNLSYIGLFLSSGAAKEDLVRFIGGIASVGC